MDMSLSLRIMSRLLGVDDTLFSPSKASPPLMAPSPMTAATCLPLPSAFAATAMPSAADMEFEACPHGKVSYGLSAGDGNGRMPCSMRLVQN